MKNVLTFLILFTVFSCKKESDKEDLITKSWTLSSKSIITPDGITTPFTLSTCETGKTWTFEKDGIFLDAPPPPCVQSFEDTLWGIWTLSKNNLKIQFTGASAGRSDIELNIIKLTASQLIVRRPGFNLGGGGRGGGFGTSPNEVQFEFIPK